MDVEIYEGKKCPCGGDLKILGKRMVTFVKCIECGNEFIIGTDRDIKRYNDLQLEQKSIEKQDKEIKAELKDLGVI